MDLSNLSDAELDALDEEAKKQEEEAKTNKTSGNVMVNPNNAWYDRPIATAQTAAELANRALSTPLGHALELGGAGAYGLSQLNKFGQNIANAARAQPLMQPPTTPTTVQPSTAPGEPTMEPRPMMEPRPVMPTRPAIPAAEIGGIRPGLEVPPIELPAGHPFLQPPAPVPTQPPTGLNFIERMESMAKQYRPVMQNLGSNIVKSLPEMARGSIPLGFALHHTTLNPNEAAELERRRKVAFQPYSNQQGQ